MFFIIDIVPGLKVLSTFIGKCRACNSEGELELIRTYQCLRLFFIPLFKWHKKYYLRHSCGAMVALSEDEALKLLYAGATVEEIKTEEVYKGPKKCPKCGQLLEESYQFCPYCGQVL